MSRRALPKKISTRSLKPVVEGVEKRILLATFTVTNTTDTVASGSLRWAIGQSNAAPGSNTINFAIPGAGVQTIAITSALPTITVPVTIDGTTEPGYSSTPLIELNGSGAGSSVDGLDISAGGSTVKGLAINRFTGEGISLSVAGGNLIENDFIGTNPGGTLAEGNSKDGVLVQVNSNGNVIKDNLISGNTANGIYLNGQLFGATNPVTSGNLVIGNLLGTDINGTATLQNHEDGIAVQNAPLSTIGGTTAAARNIVSGNGAGMELFDNSDGTVIEGNYIGTDITGEIALGNNGSNGFFKDDMVFRGISNSTIGGTVAGAGNVISGSSNNGIDCFVIGSENLAIQGNLIGTDATGTRALGNAVNGIFIGGPTGVTIGGTVVGARNVISASGDDGITTFGNGLGLTIQGNYIGTDITGTAPLGNGGDGINATFPGITIGGLGTGAGNVIANNGFTNVFDHSGVRVSTNNTPVLSNSIYGNMLDGIELDNSGNKNQAAPVLTSASATATTSAISGTLTSAVGTYTLQFFAVPTLNASNNAEGKTLIGTATVTIASGSASFTENFTGGFPAGSLITATATDSNGNTSQFSMPVTATGTGQYLANPTLGITSTALNVPAGGNVSYTFTITNPNAVADAGVVFYDLIPAGTIFDSGTTSTGASVVLSEGQATAAIGAIGANQAVTVTITLTPTTAAIPSFRNIGSVASTSPSLLPGIVEAALGTNVLASADLAVGVTTSTSSTAIGDDLYYTVTVTNKGASDATGVILSDTLPTGTTFISADPNSGPAVEYSNGVFTDDYGDLAVGQSFTVTVTVLVDVDAYPTATDSATVTADEPDPDSSNNSAEAAAPITFVSDVSILVTPGSYNTGVGQPQTYTIDVTNNGPSPALNVTFTDTLPSNATFVSATASSGAAPTESPGSVVDPIGTLEAGGTVVITITVIPTATTASTLTNVAAVTTTSTDPNTANNTVTTRTNVVPIADLAVTSVTASPNPVDDGQDVTFSIVVVNNGPSTASGATVTDTLPAGLNFVSATVFGGSVGASGQVVTADLGDLASGSSVVLTIIAMTTTAGTFTNTATVSLPVTDPDTSNNSGSTTFTVSPVVDLSVTLSGDAGPVFTGDALTYTAVVTNNGPSSATNVVFTDPLFDGATFQAIESNQVFGTLVNGVATLTLGTIAAGASETVVLTVIPTQAATVTDTSTVTSTEADSNSTNNTSSFVTTVIAPYQTISFDSATYVVAETGVFAAITLDRTGDTATASTVHFSTFGGNATPGLDYQPVDAVVTFAAGATSATVDVPVLADPYDNTNELVNLQLDNPTGGALLLQPDLSTSTGPITALLEIINLDPVLVGPTITDLKLIGLANSIIGFEVDTTGNLNPITANYTPNYTIIALGGGGKAGLAYGTVVPVASATYNASNGSVILVPETALPGNELFEVIINGEGPTALSDRAGNPLNSVLYQTPGSDYVLTVARGTTLNYTDENGTPVTLKLTGPGTLDIDRTVSGEVGRLQVVGAVAGKTVVTGTVHGAGKKTTFGTILGLGDFGSFHFDLTTPQFYVTRTVYPSSDQLTDTAAVDTLLVPPTTTTTTSKKSTKTVKVTKSKATVATTKPKAEAVKAQSIATPAPAQQALNFLPPDLSTTTNKAKTTVLTNAKHPHAATAHAIHSRKTR